MNEALAVIMHTNSQLRQYHGELVEHEQMLKHQETVHKAAVEILGTQVATLGQQNPGLIDQFVLLQEENLIVRANALRLQRINQKLKQKARFVHTSWMTLDTNCEGLSKGLLDLEEENEKLRSELEIKKRAKEVDNAGIALVFVGIGILIAFKKLL